MRVTKVLENKTVIRLFGVILIFSPFGNTLVSMSMQKVEYRWTFELFKRVLAASSTANLVLMSCSVILGLLMLSGSPKGWKFALALLGGFIAFKITRLGQDLRDHWIHGFFFLMNLGAFLFIADQLVFKQDIKSVKKPEPAPQPKPENKPTPMPVAVPTPPPRTPPSSYQSHKKILFAFSGSEPWAQLVSISNRGLEIRALKSSGYALENRELEISFSPTCQLKMKLSRQTQDLFFFEFNDLKAQDIEQINSWIARRTAVAA